MPHSVLCTPPVAFTVIAISCKRKFSHLDLKTNLLLSMTKNPSSMLSTNCRMADTRMVKKNSWWLQGEYFRTVSDQHDMNSCVNISCCCCIFSVQPVTSFLCFFVVIALIHGSIRTLRVQHELPRVFVSASFPSCRNVRMILLCDHVINSRNIFIPTFLGFLGLDDVGSSGICPIWF